MRRLNNFLHLPYADRRLLVKSILLVGAVRLGLWLLPFQILRRYLVRFSRASSKSQPVDPVLVDRVAWAVAVSSRFIPRASCLTQALATKALLSRRSQPAVLRIGVIRNESGEFLAHAWVESNGKVVIGGTNPMPIGYVSLPLVGEEIL